MAIGCHMRRLCPTISELNAFHTAAKHASFTLAARELCVTQGAISRHIASLESYVNQQLFVRSPTGLQLTEAGQTYFSATQPCISALELATAQMRARGSTGGTLNMSIPPTFATQWLLPRMGELKRALPHFELNFVRYLHVPNFSGQTEFDAAIVFGEGSWPHAVSHYLTGHEVSLVCSPALRDALHSPADVARHTLLQHIEVPDAWPEWMRSHGLETSESRFGPGFTQYALIIRAAEAGFGIGLVPTCMAELELQTGSLVEPFARFESVYGYYLSAPASKAKLPALRTLHEWLMHCLQHASTTSQATCPFCKARMLPHSG
jgi:LysR family glycine cleavage system transcriptional activator